VRGVCKHCGAERDFPTTNDAVVWQDTGHRAPPVTILEPSTATSGAVPRLGWDELTNTPG
jgi:hypothetical protein